MFPNTILQLAHRLKLGGRVCVYICVCSVYEYVCVDVWSWGADWQVSGGPVLWRMLYLQASSWGVGGVPDGLMGKLLPLNQWPFPQRKWDTCTAFHFLLEVFKRSKTTGKNWTDKLVLKNLTCAQVKLLNIRPQLMERGKKRGNWLNIFDPSFAKLDHLQHCLFFVQSKSTHETHFPAAVRAPLSAPLPLNQVTQISEQVIYQMQPYMHEATAISFWHWTSPQEHKV